MPAFADRINASTVKAFGEVVTWTPSGGSAMAKRGIFDERHLDVQQDDGSVISSLFSTLAVIASDWPGVAKGDAVIARSTAYVMVDVRTDGQDMKLLVLGADVGGSSA